MFGNDPRDLCETLTTMRREAINKCRSNQHEAARLMAAQLELDRRFDAFDKQKLVSRVQLHVSNGAQLNLDDPSLKAGGTSWEQSRKY